MAETYGLPTPSIDWNSQDAPNAFRKFKNLCELMFEGPLADKTEAVKIRYLLIWAGEEGQELASTWKLTNEEKKLLETYWTKFEQYVKPKSNFRLARYKLRTLKQDPSEAVDVFMKKARILVNECKYVDSSEQLIDALIFGTNSRDVQAKLLKKDETLTIDQALNIARTEEATKQQLKDIGVQKQDEGKDGKQIDAMKSKSSSRKCSRCGKVHNFSPRSACPAHNSTCDNCGKPNHWAIVCRSTTNEDTKKANRTKPSAAPRRQQKQMHAMNTNEWSDTEEDNTDEEILTITVAEVSTSNEKEAIITLPIKSSERTKEVRCKIDTGADGNVLPVKVFRSLCPSQCNPKGVPTGLHKSKAVITVYGGGQIKHYGICQLQITHRGKTVREKFHVVQANGSVIIGLPTLKKLNLITLNYSISMNSDDAKTQVLKEYGDCFQGIGCFPGVYNITTDPQVPPVVHPARKVPLALQKPLKVELQNLEKQGILAKVKRPTDWVNSCLCVTKANGTIRLCLDPKDLNKAIKRPYHYMPTLDNILPRLNGAKYFSILDARSGYWNIKLSDESSYLTTFNTPYGRYRFLRLPFGLVCAQDVFQRKVDETFGDLPGVTGIADDIVVVGYKEDGSDHDYNLKQVLERCRSTGLRLNPDKLRVKCEKIPFFGNIIGAKGLEPDPAKVQAISAMEAPTNVNEVQTFLGMVTYMGRFTAQLSDMTAPLRDLCKKSSEFTWNPEHQRAFDKIKATLSSAPTLQYFDSRKPVTIQVDASQRGLGAVLLQDNGPIEYASKSLSDAETRYSNIEREMLAVLYGLERFHYYAYGRNVTVETDHKPLEAIQKKDMHNAPPRIARMLMKVNKYDVHIKYVSAKNVPVADTLSRMKPMAGEEVKGLDITIHEIHAYVNATEPKVERIKAETAKDTVLSALKEVIHSGWPASKSDCPKHIAEFWNYKEELSVADGMVMKATSIIIPTSMRPTVLDKIHYGHMGVEKCRLRARGSVFWPRINDDIETHVKECRTCQRNQNSQRKEPLMPHDIPPRPWHTLGSDLFFFNNATYLLVADYYSKFTITKKLGNNTTTSNVIRYLKVIFSEHGIPEKMVTDNGPQFAANEFHEFATAYGFHHTTSSPRYPQSNGFIERMVQTVKNVLKKSRESNSDPYMAMLCLNSTPISNKLPSPCELLTGRAFKSNLPRMHQPSDPEVKDRLKERQEVQEKFYNKGSRELSTLLPDQPVRMYVPEKEQWEPATVLQQDAPRSYTVSMNDTTYRRNRRHLVPVPANEAAKETDEHTGQPPNHPSKDSPPENKTDEPPTSSEKSAEKSPSPPLRRSTRMKMPVKRYGLE